jgi:hypothetical protein
MAVGGDITEITVNHPSLGSKTLFPKAGEDSTYDTGGFRSNDDANSVDGGGNDIVQLTRNRWSFQVVISNDFNTNNEMEYLSSLSASPVDADWTFTNINGTVYGGKGRPVGDVQANGNNTQISLKVAGGGSLKKQ